MTRELEECCTRCPDCNERVCREDERICDACWACQRCCPVEQRTHTSVIRVRWAPGVA